MPPTQSSRFAPQHLSNPYAHLTPPGHLPQPTNHLPNNHQGFNSNVFTPSSGNAQIPLGSAFNAGMNTGMGGGGGGTGGGGGMGHAQGGFAVQGYQMQQRHGQGGDGGKQETRVREVWKHNLAQEMALLRKLIDDYPYVSMVGL